MLSKKWRPKNRRVTRRLALLVAPLMFLAVGNVGEAHASWRNGPLLNLHYYKCLDAGQSVLIMYGCNGSAAQEFQDISSLSTYQLYNPLENKCIDMGDFSNGWLHPCNGGLWQQFYVQFVTVAFDGRAYYQIRNVQDSRYCLDSYIHSVPDFQSCNGGDYQLWTWM